MRTNLLVFALLACIGGGRRLQTAIERIAAAIGAISSDNNSDRQSIQAGVFSALTPVAAVLLEFNHPAAVRQTDQYQSKRPVKWPTSDYASIGGALPARRMDSSQMLEDSSSTPKFTKFPIPVGPFCPFRSATTNDTSMLAEGMDKLTDFNMESFATEFGRMTLEMQMGNMPEPEKVLQMADQLSKAEEIWQITLTRMRMAEDFQALEYYKLTEAWSKRQGNSLETVGAMMRWQADSMRAFASGRPPPMPPAGVDLTKLGQQTSGPGPGALAAAQAINSRPFTGTEPIFQSEVVKAEYLKLCEDHATLIGMGQSYNKFGMDGKLVFLDKVEEIESRWDTFYSRQSLLGNINPEFEKDTNEYFDSMGLTYAELRELLAQAHDIMRKDADPLWVPKKSP